MLFLSLDWQASQLRVMYQFEFDPVDFARIHKMLRITPAMAAGLSDHVRTLEEIILMADSYMPKPAKRGPYKKSAA